MIVCKDWLEKLHQMHDNKENTVAIVQDDIASILNGKSLEQLSQLQRQITAKFESNESIDVEYWEGLLKRLVVHKAKVRHHCRRSQFPLIVFSDKVEGYARGCRPQSSRTTTETTKRRGAPSARGTSGGNLEAALYKDLGR